MKSIVIVFAFSFIAGLFAACDKRSEVVATSNTPLSWPPLAEFHYVSGRAATEDDISAGRAAFVLQDAGKSIGAPIAIAIPQYAFYRDEKSGVREPCIVIQAEEARGQKVIGAASISDRSLKVGLFQDFELLGTTSPKP